MLEISQLRSIKLSITNQGPYILKYIHINIILEF